MARISIEGLGAVEVDDAFLKLLPADQQKTIAEIIQASKKRPSTAMEKANMVARGFNVGLLADTLGAPVDLANWLLSATPLGGSDEPVGGSAQIRSALTGVGSGFESLEDLRDDQRAYARGGQTVGQVTGMAAPIFGAAGRVSPARAAVQAPPVGSTGGNIVREMVRSTAAKPGRMAAIEGTSALGAGAGRFLSESIAPGDENLGMLAEVVGGVAGPLPLVKSTLSKTRALAEGFTPSGREQAASRKVREILEEGKFLTRDPDVDEGRISDLVRELRQVEPGYGTTAQVTSAPQARKIFSALENKLVQDAGDEMVRAVKDQKVKTAEIFDRQIRKLNNSTNPLVVKEAQALRMEYFKRNLDARVNKAQGRADDAVTRVLTKNSDDAVKASSEARKIIDNELALARKTETKLWGEVDKGVNAPTEETIKAFNSVKDEIGPAEQLVKPLEAFMQGLIKREGIDFQPGRSGNFRSAKELFRKRSVTLSLARQASSTGRFNDARLLNQIADGMLADLNRVTDSTAVVARGFSRDLNEKFNTKLIRGLRKGEPGVFLEKASQASDAQRAFNFNALKRATERSVDTMEQGQTTALMNKLQKDFMESSAAQTVDPFTNQIKPAAFSRFIKNNELTLKEVNLVGDLGDIEQKVKLASMLQKSAKSGKAFVEKKSLAAQITRGSDDLGEVLAKAFDSPHQVDAFRDLSRTVTRANDPNALEGLRHGVFEELLKRATVRKGDFEGLISGQRLEEILQAPSGRKTLRDNLIDSKLLTREQSGSLNKIIQKATIFEEAAMDRNKLNSIITTGDGLINLLARWSGAQMGAATAAGKGAPLMMAGAGSRAMQKFLEKVPALKVQGVLTEAIRNPKLMADLLELAPKATKQVGQRINAYLLQAGLID